MEKDTDTAFIWFEKAAEQGHVDAMWRIASKYYYTGKGYEKNDAKFVKWLMKAVEKEYYPAMEWLAYCFEGGLYGGPKIDGIEKDKAKAKEWTRKAGEAKKKGFYNRIKCSCMYNGVLDQDNYLNMKE